MQKIFIHISPGYPLKANGQKIGGMQKKILRRKKTAIRWEYYIFFGSTYPFWLLCAYILLIDYNNLKLQHNFNYQTQLIYFYL